MEGVFTFLHYREQKWKHSLHFQFSQIPRSLQMWVSKSVWKLKKKKIHPKISGFIWNTLVSAMCCWIHSVVLKEQCLGSCWIPAWTNGSCHPGTKMIFPSGLFRIRDVDGFCISSLPLTSYSTSLPLSVLKMTRILFFLSGCSDHIVCGEFYVCKCVCV